MAASNHTDLRRAAERIIREYAEHREAWKGVTKPDDAPVAAGLYDALNELETVLDIVTDTEEIEGKREPKPRHELADVLIGIFAIEMAADVLDQETDNTLRPDQIIGVASLIKREAARCHEALYEHVHAEQS